MTDAASSSSRPSIRCYVSYAHDDETSLGFVDDFAKDLSHFTYSDSGRRLEVFVDHDSIGWGDDWRERIRDSIDTALVFIPLITLQYLDRPMCREELNLFVDSAEKLGVTDLFLPVVVLGHRHVTERSSDPVARLVAKRQYKDFRAAVIDGAGSATWRATLLDLSEALVAAVDSAEARLLQASKAAVEVADRAAVPSTTGDVEDDDAPGLLELMIEIDSGGNRLTELVKRFAELMVDFQNTVTPLSAQFQGADSDTIRLVYARLAESVCDISAEMEAVGTELETITTRVDGALRSTWHLASRTGHDGLKTSLRTNILGSDGNSFASLGEVVEVMTQVLNEMAGVEVISVPMRNALRPLRKGVTSVRSAVRTVQSWPNLVQQDHLDNETTPFSGGQVSGIPRARHSVDRAGIHHASSSGER